MLFNGSGQLDSRSKRVVRSGSSARNERRHVAVPFNNKQIRNDTTWTTNRQPNSGLWIEDCRFYRR